ncbi:hypothetical protein Deba_1513 [Desulfarculus baarsii DSM 2075]|uniref:DUF4398 domain-containing protein n=1 Tax=Desulfarculus baarsii (strain ATCC 33931 / DSM 2075 / LMG 7858 / VKM B-1802 / 2st14) TaxID=644282 RepID=E1QH38_DESB2|nr:hypothetical protein [Desulfarculus baarsii]ADK84881.1 hypothetical protein Deba_1513 [Desulfarculus baarsii DSM 2075]
MKTMLRLSIASLFCLAALLAGCADGTTPITTRAIEERYLGMGEAVRMYEYGELLLADGRYKEAYTAFLSAEQNAYTSDLREAARKRRMWLGESIKAMEAGGQPLPPPADLGEKPDLRAAAPQRPSTSPSTTMLEPPLESQQLLPGLRPGDPPIIIPAAPASPR